MINPEQAEAYEEMAENMRVAGSIHWSAYPAIVSGLSALNVIYYGLDSASRDDFNREFMVINAAFRILNENLTAGEPEGE